MCGIAGFQGQFEAGRLQAMANALAHRGPDGEGFATLGEGDGIRTGLAHRRLAIIDLSEGGRQPMTVCADAGGHQQSGLTLIFNGEIYNYRELRAELEKDGHGFRSASDSETLLHLYERDGLGMVDRLNGIFALALHDDRPSHRPPGVEQGTLFLARDHLGVKPLYFAELPRGFLFASEMKAILTEPTLPRELDPIAIHHLLAYMWTPAPRTVLAAVRKLEPGSALLVSGGRVTRKWSFNHAPYDGTVLAASEDEIARELADRLEAAVERQLVSDVPVGAYLSGGLDSSAVVAMMRRRRPDQQLPCFVVGFRGDADLDDNPSDLPYARAVARHLKVDLHEIEMEPSAIEELPSLVEMLDEPQGDPAPIGAMMVAQRARAMGIPVLLSGAGGDDLFTGYRRHLALSLEPRWTWLPHSVRAAMQSAASAAAGGRGRWQSVSAMRRAAKMFAYAGEDDDRRLASYFFWSTEPVRRSLYSPALAAQLANEETARPLLDTLREIPAEHDRLQRMLHLETRHFLADHNLNYTDRAGMAAGVEVRVPLLDRDLVAFAARIPPRMKQRGRVGKAIFKRAMEPYLPHDVIYRPKTGFGAPLRRWLRRELQPLISDTLSPAALRRRGLFEPKVVDTLVAQDRRGEIDGAYTIFALMCLELWCRRFLD